MIKYLLLLPFLLLPHLSHANDVTTVAGTNLVAYWEFEETSGVRYDSYASFDLNDNNTVLSASGKQGLAADCEASNSEYLSRASDDESLDLASGNWTVSFWFKFETTPTSFGYSPSFFAKEVLNSGWNARVSYADAKFNWVKNDAVTYDSTTGFTSGTWYYLTITKDTNIKVYVNGTLESTSAYISHGNTNGYFNVCRSPYYTTRYFDGLIDELGIWSTALSSSTIASLYNAGNGLPYQQEATTSTGYTAVSYFNMYATTTCSTTGATSTCTTVTSTSTPVEVTSENLSVILAFVIFLVLLIVMGLMWSPFKKVL